MIIMRFFSSWSFPNGFRIVHKTACRALSLSFPPGIIPLTKGIENSTKFLCERCTEYARWKESANRAGSSLEAGAPCVVVHRLLVYDGAVVVDLESEALEDECSAGKRTKVMLSTDKARPDG